MIMGPPSNWNMLSTALFDFGLVEFGDFGRHGIEGRPDSSPNGDHLHHHVGKYARVLHGPACKRWTRGYFVLHTQGGFFVHDIAGGAGPTDPIASTSGHTRGETSSTAYVQKARNR